MAEYLVKVADEQGHVREQVQDAQSEAELRDRFSQQGYFVYWVRPRGMLSGGSFSLPGQRRLKLEQFVIFNQQFLTLIRAGLPILHALDLLLRRQRSAYFGSLLERVRDKVKSGALLSDAFAEQGVFPKIYSTTLLAGEKSGNLEEVLNRYITYQRMALGFRKKLLTSLIYPTLLVIMVIVMLTFLVTYVVPQFGNLFGQLQLDLPPLTIYMLQVGAAAQRYFLLVVGAVVLLFFVLWKWKHTERGAEQADRLRLKIPILGAVWLKYQVAVFCRMMSTLLAGGLPLVPALQTAGASMESRLIAMGVNNAAQRVREGMPLARSLEETGSFPELAVEMIEVGESTGALPAMLTSVAEFYEDDVQTALTAAMSLIEPAILIIMGCVVAFVLLSLYLPIFTLGAGGVR